MSVSVIVYHSPQTEIRLLSELTKRIRVVTMLVQPMYSLFLVERGLNNRKFKPRMHRRMTSSVIVYHSPQTEIRPLSGLTKRMIRGLFTKLVQPIYSLVLVEHGLNNRKFKPRIYRRVTISVIVYHSPQMEIQPLSGRTARIPLIPMLVQSMYSLFLVERGLNNRKFRPRMHRRPIISVIVYHSPRMEIRPLSGRTARIPLIPMLVQPIYSHRPALREVKLFFV